MNVRWLRTGALFCLAGHWSAATAWSAFERTPRAARSSALGGAGVALVGSGDVLFLNPAGLAVLPRPCASFLWAKPDAGLGATDLNEGHAAVALPIRPLAVGVGAAYFNGAGLVREFDGYLGVAHRGRRWSAGASVEYLRHDYAVEDDPVFDGRRARGAATFNVGLLARPAPSLTLGAVAHRVTQPDVGLRVADPVARDYQAGAAYTHGRWRWVADGLLRARAATPSDESPLSWSVGLECLLRPLTLRAGTAPRRWAAGLGLALISFGLDYAAVFDGQGAGRGAGTHRVSVSWSWPVAPARPRRTGPEVR